MSATPARIGRAPAVLVFGQGQAAVATISAVVARRRTDHAKERLQFAGPATFTPAVNQHLTETVLPVADRIAGLLGLPTVNYELSVVNLGAASAQDLPLMVTGFSADLPVFLAILSEAMKLPLLQDVVATGHIASNDGDIRPVRSIDAKLAAAAAQPGIRKFVHPAMDADSSFGAMAPRERRRIDEAIARVADRLQLVGIAHVESLLRHTMEDETIVLSSLRAGFFGRPIAIPESGGSIAAAARFLGNGNETRFWSALELHALAGDSDDVSELLQAWVTYHCSRATYPTGFGGRLYNLLAAVTPAVRRLKLRFPLLTPTRCLELSRFATVADAEDVAPLLAAAAGRVGAQRPQPKTPAEAANLAAEGVSALDVALAQINVEALAREIDRPIDAARAAYVLTDIIVDSFEEFLDTVAAFHLAVLRRTQMVPATADVQSVAKEAVALLDRAFAELGGARAAWVRAEQGVDGGMRFVLDRLADQFKAEQQAKHISWVLKECLDPLSSGQKTVVVQALLDRINPHMPPESRFGSAEELASDYEKLVRAYAQSLEHMRLVLRRL